MSKTKRISALTAGVGFLTAACWLVTALPLSAQPPTVADAAGVTVDLAGNNILHRTGVSYPEAAIKAHVQGVVTVEASLDSSGNVLDAHVVSGPPELRRSVLQSVLQWHFAMDNATLTRRVNINFSTPPAPGAGAAGGVPGGVIGGVIGPPPPNRMIESVASVAPSPRMNPYPAFVGKTFAGYMVAGLTGQSRQDLLARMPIREGETLAEDSFERISKAVRDFDEHLSVGRVTYRGGDVGAAITAPGAMMRPEVMSSSATPSAFPPPSTDPNAPKRITIGGNVQQAKLISQPRPEYPALAKQARISGVVHLQALIAVDGTVKALSLISGHPLLVPAALEAVQHWTYQTTLLNGQPVEVVTQIDVNFTLSE
jgi:TonB family protein